MWLGDGDTDGNDGGDDDNARLYLHLETKASAYDTPICSVCNHSDKTSFVLTCPTVVSGFGIRTSVRHFCEQ